MNRTMGTTTAASVSRSSSGSKPGIGHFSPLQRHCNAVAKALQGRCKAKSGQECPLAGTRHIVPPLASCLDTGAAFSVPNLKRAVETPESANQPVLAGFRQQAGHHPPSGKRPGKLRAPGRHPVRPGFSTRGKMPFRLSIPLYIGVRRQRLPRQIGCQEAKKHLCSPVFRLEGPFEAPAADLI